MHRFFVPDAGPHGAAFSPEQRHQLRDVLRLRAGESVRVFNGIDDVDYVVSLDGRVIDTHAHAPEPTTCVCVYAALLQRDKFETVLQKLTEVGAAQIVPTITARSLVRSAPDRQRYERWRAILREAAEQSGRGRVPELCDALPLRAAVARARGLSLVAHPGAELSLARALEGRPSEVSLFVGPEGGFTPEEVQLAHDHRAQVVGLGARTLRAETASPVLAALVLYELGQL
jgi:16S rRNA (uracil1498-N3)-methyltransferase